MYVVSLLYPPFNSPYKPGYFPRKFAYKKDAQALVDEVKRNGGCAIIRKGK